MAIANYDNLMIAHPGTVKTLSTATAVRPAALSEIMFRVYRPPPAQPAGATPTPLLSDDQETHLKATPTQGQTPIQDFTVGSSKLRPLSTWLANPATALVQCTKDSLRIQLGAVADTNIQLFPLSGQITASLVNLPGNSAALPLTVAYFDSGDRRLVLSLPFPVGAASEALYVSLITAMQDHASTVGVTLFFTHLYAVMATGAQPAAPQATIVSSGEGVLRGTWFFSFDKGAETNGPGADVWWEQQTAVQRSLVPRGTAGIVNLGHRDFDSLALDELRKQNYGTAPIPGNADASNQLAVGDVFAVHTQGGNFAKVVVVEYGYNLKLRWITYGWASASVSPPLPGPPDAQPWRYRAAITRPEAVIARPELMTNVMKTVKPGPPTPPTPPRTPAPPPQPQRQERSVALQFTFAIYRPRDSQPDPYPGLPKSDTTKAWSSWVDPNDQDNIDLRVYFKSSDSQDQYFYLPTSYKLGFFADDQGGLQAPISAQFYLKDDDYRVKVKLVALPYIDDAVREKVRDYICAQVLNGVPFVRLVPAAGIDCKFASDIVPASDSSTSGQNLPASIQFTAGDNLELDKRLTFEFDMKASDYALFGEILKHGVRGTLLVQDGAGFKQGIDVSMKLGEGEVIANSLDFKVDTDTASNTAKVTLNNRLDFPVDLTSARAFFTKYEEKFGVTFKSERRQFLPAQDQTATVFAEKGKDQASVVLPLTPSSSDWNQVGIVLGTATVKAGSAEDWLNRVNQDTSLQPQRFKIHADLIVPDAAKQAIQVIQLKLYRDGDSTPRKDLQLPPSSSGADLIVEMTLTELMGSGGKQATFSIEYYSIYQDGSLGLPQRLALDFTTADLVLTALHETPASLYMLVYNDETNEHRVSGDRASTEAALNHLRDGGGHWHLLARAPTPEDGSTTAPASPAGA